MGDVLGRQARNDVIDGHDKSLRILQCQKKLVVTFYNNQ